MNQTLKDYIEISKPGILILVTVTTVVGYLLGAHGMVSFALLFKTLLGTIISCAGAGALNHYLERDADALMNRTKNRPLPSGRLNPLHALSYGIIASIIGSSFLAWQVNLLCGFLALMTTFLYALVYTPLKKTTWINTIIGAIPGALPIMGGWAAATSSLELPAWILFAIMFIWQHPHFYAIAWICREDYARGGFKMLPVIDPHGKRTFRQIVFFSLLLLPVSVLPTLIGLSGNIYFFGALSLGLMMITYSFMCAKTGQNAEARRLFKFSLVYLPVLFALIVIDSNIVTTSTRF